jgi:hypothetical protein
MLRNKPLTYPDPRSINTPAYPSLKIAGAACLSLAIILGISPSGSTIATFFNKEGAAANAFQAGTWESAPPERAAPQEAAAQPDAPSLVFSEAQVVQSPDADEQQAGEPPAADMAPPEQDDAPSGVALGEVQVVDTPPADTTPADTPPAETPPEPPPSE